MANTKPNIGPVVDLLRDLIMAAHGAASTAEPASDTYKALADLIDHASASAQLLTTYMEDK